MHGECFFSRLTLFNYATVKQVNASIRVSGVPLIVSDHTYSRPLLVQLSKEVHHRFTVG